MFTDAHCHPFDLACVFPEAEEERRRMGVLAAASATDFEEFAHNEALAHNAATDRAAGVLPCFAIHPQMAVRQFTESMGHKKECDEQLEILDMLASEGRLAAVGETGFDLYNAAFRETEAVQERLFAAHLETALRYDLPVVLHVRRAMHKIFAEAISLAKCRAVIFHSWPGTPEEGEALLRRGVNAYFSFGNAVMLNHRQAMHCCAEFAAERLLTETDAPFQAPRGQSYSQWADLPRIIEAVSALRGELRCKMRREAGSPAISKELEVQIEENFRAAFGEKRN